MTRPQTIAMMALTALLTFGGVAAGEEGRARRGEVRGVFVRLAEREVGEREYLAVVVDPFEGDEHVTLLIPRRQRDLMERARRLRKGQKVEIGYVVEDRQRWVTRIEAERLDRDDDGRDKDDDDRKMQAQLKELRTLLQRLTRRIERIEKELRELRAENARLKRQLGHETGPERDKPDREAAIPEGLRGFRGMLLGTVVRKLDRGFVLKIDKIGRTWKENKAANPKQAIGRHVRVVVNPRSRLGEKHLRTLRTLKPGDHVVAEAFHYEGNVLTLVEELRKAG